MERTCHQGSLSLGGFKRSDQDVLRQQHRSHSFTCPQRLARTMNLINTVSGAAHLADVRGLCCHQGACWRPCSGCRGPCCHWKACGGPWSLLLLAVRGREASFKVVSITIVWWHRMRAIEDFCDNPPTIPVSPCTPKRNSLDRSHSRSPIKLW